MNFKKSHLAISNIIVKKLVKALNNVYVIITTYKKKHSLFRFFFLEGTEKGILQPKS